MRCDWCGSDDVEDIGMEYTGWPIVVCKDCGHEFCDQSRNLKNDDDDWFEDILTDLDEYEIQKHKKRHSNK